MNEGYEHLRDAICPRHWTDEAQAAANAQLDAYARENGAMALQGAISGGQYSHPSGLFYGGNAPTWSARTLVSVISEHAGNASHVGLIDYHTGLGPYGYGELISDHRQGEPGHDRLTAWLGADEVTSTDDGSSSSAPLTGVNGQGIASALPEDSLTMVTLEYGTSPVPEVLNSLRADCWLHNHGDLESSQGRAIKAEIRRCFYPDADDWKQSIWDRAIAIERKMIKGLRSLD